MDPVKNLPMLLNLAYVSYNRALPGDNGAYGDFQPIFNSDGTVKTTFCNQAMQYILNGFGYGAMNGMSANEMVQFMSDHANGWISPADDNTAQAHANTGVIVFSGISNPSGHGHVNLILPGILEKSPSWSRPVPKCMNVGKDVFFGKRLSWAYVQNDQPKYFALASQI